MKDWLVQTLGIDPNFALGLQVIIALVVILALIGIFTWILARIKGVRTATARRSRQPRLAVMDSTPIDNQRRLLLVRRDAVEHLILVGGETDIVVEQTIVRGAPVAAHPQRQPYPVPVQAPAPVQAQPPVPAPAQATNPVPVPVPQPAQAHSQPQATQPQPVPPAAQRPRPASQQPPTPAAQQSAPNVEAQARASAPQTSNPQLQTSARDTSIAARAKSGLAGAAGVLGLRSGKRTDTPDTAPEPKQPSAAAGTTEQAPALSPVQPPPPAKHPRPTGEIQRQDPPAPASDVSTAAPKIDLEQAIGRAVLQETVAATAPPDTTSATKATDKISPKDELANQLEELLSTPAPEEKSAPEPAPVADVSAKDSDKDKDDTPPKTETEAPEKPAFAIKAETKAAPPVSISPAAQTISTANGQATGPDLRPAEQPKPQPSTPPPFTPGKAPEVITPASGDTEKAVSALAPKVEPQLESAGAASTVLAGAPEVASPVAPDLAVETANKDEKPDSIASIEEEMAKLLSELSGPPKN